MTHARIEWRRLFASTGLAIAAALWTVNTQLGEMLPEWQCRERSVALGLISLTAALLSVLSAAVSWRAPWSSPVGWFWSRLCTFAALLFAFALLLQGAAGFMLSGCEK